MPCMKRVYRNQKMPVYWSAARWEKALLVLLIPGHALHEKGLQRHKGVVPLFGSQEQSALLVPVINR